MLLLAEYVPATMLDPTALGTALEFHILTFIEQYSGPQGRRRCLAAVVLDIWHGTGSSGHGTEIFGTARIHQIWARHGTGRPCWSGQDNGCGSTGQGLAAVNQLRMDVRELASCKLTHGQAVKDSQVEWKGNVCHQ